MPASPSSAPAVDFVSPLPPVRSGIADYSVDLLDELAPLCDLRLVRLPGQEIASHVLDRYPVVDAAALDPAGRLPFYQMGNNVYHEGVRRLALDSPGVVTVHDLRLHHLLVESTLASGDLDAYVSGLGEEHGWEGAAAALSIRWGGHGRARLFEMPAHRSLLLRQRGLLTHSDWGLRFLEEELGEESGRAGGRLPPMRRVPMPMPAPALPGPEQAAAWRRRAGVPRSAVLIGSFGFQTPIKRTDVLLRVLAEPGMEQAHALVVGEVAAELDLDALARDLGVQDRVTMAGFLDAAAFPTAIAACDLCLNLRYPSAGETSASLLRILALGRAAVVSDYAQFVELPDDIVIKAPLKDDPGAEAGALAFLLRGLLAAPDRLTGMGAAARAFIEREHRPASVARAVFEALDEWSRAPAGRADCAAAAASPHLVDLGLVAGADRGGGLRPALAGWRAPVDRARRREHGLRHLALGPQPGRRRRARAPALERRAGPVPGQAVDSAAAGPAAGRLVPDPPQAPATDRPGPAPVRAAPLRRRFDDALRRNRLRPRTVIHGTVGRRWSWLLLAGLLLALFASTMRSDAVGAGEREVTFRMAALSLAWDGDLSYGRADYDRYVRLLGGEPEAVALESSTGGARIGFARPPAYAVLAAPFVRISPRWGAGAAELAAAGGCGGRIGPGARASHRSLGAGVDRRVRRWHDGLHPVAAAIAGDVPPRRIGSGMGARRSRDADGRAFRAAKRSRESRWRRKWQRR